MKTSKLFSLNIQDFLKAIVIAILTPALVIIQQSVEAGSFTIDWKHVLMAAVGGFTAYLIKNFLTPAKTIQDATTNEPKPGA